MFLETEESSRHVKLFLECLKRERTFNNYNNTSPYSRLEINKQPSLTHFEKVKLVSILTRLSLQVTQRWKCRSLSLDKNRFSVPRSNDDFVLSGLGLYQLWFELQVHNFLLKYFKERWCHKWPHLSNTVSFIQASYISDSEFMTVF